MSFETKSKLELFAIIVGVIAAFMTPIIVMVAGGT